MDLRSIRFAASEHDTEGDVLLRGLEVDPGKWDGIWAGKDDDKALALGKTIETLAGFVDCSSHCPGTASLAQQLMAISWPLHLSPFPQVRRAVILAVACALKHTRMDQLAVSPNNELWLSLSAWMGVTKERDPDEECRKLAGLISIDN